MDINKAMRDASSLALRLEQRLLSLDIHTQQEQIRTTIGQLDKVNADRLILVRAAHEALRSIQSI